VAQAQWTASLGASSATQWHVVPVPTSLSGAFAPHAALAGALPQFGAEVQDTFGVTYRAPWVESGAEPATTLQETPLVRVRRLHAYHRSPPGQGIRRDYLTSTFYLTEFRDQPLVLVDWLFGNDYLGADDPHGSSDPNLHPLGGVDVNRASFLLRGADLALPYRSATEGIGPPEASADGFTAFPVLQDSWLGDGQTRRWRFVLLDDAPAATPAARAAARATAQAMIDTPLRPLATHASWRATNALGLLGGPQNPPSDAAVRVQEDYSAWIQANDFGTFGAHGDPLATGQTGTPRNGPITPELAHAVQSNDTRLLLVLEQKAWVQALRPYHLYGLRVENGDDLLLWDGVPIYPGSRDLSRESLGRRALLGHDPWPGYRTRVQAGANHAHGFEPFDEEHWSSDLLFDYWTVSGDAWAKDELRQLGESLRGLLRPHGYSTSSLQSARAEGWCMQGFVEAFLATGDLRFRDAALDRLHDIVDRDRPHGHPSGALRIESNEVRTGFPMPHRYYMPWQHGAVLHGYLAGWKFFGDPLYLSIANDVARCVDYAWVRNWNDPQFGFVADGLRYYAPVEYAGVPALPSVFDATLGVRFGDSPLGGAHSELLGGLLLLARTTTDVDAQARAEQYGELLMQLPLDNGDHWDKWFALLPPDLDH
jgi:hypothetical protein